MHRWLPSALTAKRSRLPGSNPADQEIVRATAFEHYEFSLINAPAEAVIEGITLRYGQMYIIGAARRFATSFLIDAAGPALLREKTP
jgi:hypothetical protein